MCNLAPDIGTLHAACIAFLNGCKCPLCDLPWQKASTFPCGHTFCYDCAIATLEGPGISQSECPTCKAKYWKRDLKPNPQMMAIVEHAQKILSIAELQAAVASGSRAQGGDARSVQRAGGDPGGGGDDPGGGGDDPGLVLPRATPSAATSRDQPATGWALPTAAAAAAAAQAQAAPGEAYLAGLRQPSPCPAGASGDPGPAGRRGPANATAATEGQPAASCGEVTAAVRPLERRASPNGAPAPAALQHALMEGRQALVLAEEEAQPQGQVLLLTARLVGQAADSSAVNTGGGHGNTNDMLAACALHAAAQAAPAAAAVGGQTVGSAGDLAQGCPEGSWPRQGPARGGDGSRPAAAGCNPEREKRTPEGASCSGRVVATPLHAAAHGAAGTGLPYTPPAADVAAARPAQVHVAAAAAGPEQHGEARPVDVDEAGGWHSDALRRRARDLLNAPAAAPASTTPLAQGAALAHLLPACGSHPLGGIGSAAMATPHAQLVSQVPRSQACGGGGCWATLSNGHPPAGTGTAGGRRKQLPGSVVSIRRSTPSVNNAYLDFHSLLEGPVSRVGRLDVGPRPTGHLAPQLGLGAFGLGFGGAGGGGRDEAEGSWDVFAETAWLRRLDKLPGPTEQEREALEFELSIVGAFMGELQAMMAELQAGSHCIDVTAAVGMAAGGREEERVVRRGGGGGGEPTDGCGTGSEGGEAVGPGQTGAACLARDSAVAGGAALPSPARPPVADWAAAAVAAFQPGKLAAATMPQTLHRLQQQGEEKGRWEEEQQPQQLAGDGSLSAALHAGCAGSIPAGHRVATDDAEVFQRRAGDNAACPTGNTAPNLANELGSGSAGQQPGCGCNAGGATTSPAGIRMRPPARDAYEHTGDDDNDERGAGGPRRKRARAEVSGSELHVQRAPPPRDTPSSLSREGRGEQPAEADPEDDAGADAAAGGTLPGPREGPLAAAHTDEAAAGRGRGQQQGQEPDDCADGTALGAGASEAVVRANTRRRRDRLQGKRPRSEPPLPSLEPQPLEPQPHLAQPASRQAPQQQANQRQGRGAKPRERSSMAAVVPLPPAAASELAAVAVAAAGPSARRAKTLHLLSTGLSGEERGRLKELTRRVRGLELLNDVQPQLTHLVVSLDERGQLVGRTIKYMRAVVQGCWVVGMAWVDACLAAGRLLPEGPFEAAGDAVQRGTPAASRLRLERGEPPLFSGLRFCVMYLRGTFEGFTKPDIEGLLQAAGGTLVRRPAHRAGAPAAGGGGAPMTAAAALFGAAAASDVYDGSSLYSQQQAMPQEGKEAGGTPRPPGMPPVVVLLAPQSNVDAARVVREWGCAPVQTLWVYDCISHYKLLSPELFTVGQRTQNITNDVS